MTKVARILAMLRNAPATSQEIAVRLRFPRKNVSVALCQLAAFGVVERAGTVNLRRVGRPYVRWRLRSQPQARVHANQASRPME